jgi:hypothetical protein
VLIIHGVYRWLPKRTAFRRDYCRRCESGTLSVLVRTFNVFHVFWLPLLPLGVWGRWLCVRCGTNPHAATVTRLGFKVALVLLLVLFNAAAWLTPTGTASIAEIWLTRAVASVLLLLAIRWVVRHRPEPAFESRLADVPPFDSWECPLCGGQLLQVPPLVQCPSCKAEHRPLRRAA